MLSVSYEIKSQFNACLQRPNVINQSDLSVSSF